MAQSNPSVWTTAPDRYFQDIVAPPGALTPEALREIFLSHGMGALTQNTETRLILSPPRGFSSKRVAGRAFLHRNTYVEVGLVVRGDMWIWWEGSTTHCPQGSIFVIPPGIHYMPHAKPAKGQPEPHTVIWLALHRDSTIAHQCGLRGSDHLLSEYYSFTNTHVMNQARGIADEMAERAPYFESAIRGYLLCLFTGLLRAPSLPITRLKTPILEQKDNAKDAFSQKVEAFLLSHYHRPLSLPLIARAIGCSPTYLCRHFRAMTGQTVFQYLLSVRLEAARHLLASDIPIGRVAEMVGFDDALYFSRVFSKQSGESPQTYRRRIQTV